MQFWKKKSDLVFVIFGFHFFLQQKRIFSIVLWKCIFHWEITPKLFFLQFYLFFFLCCISFSHSSVSTWHQQFSMYSQDRGDYIVYTLLSLMAFISGVISLEIIEFLLLSPRMLDASLNTAWHSSVKDLLLQYSIAVLVALILCQHTHTCLPLVCSPFFIPELPDWKEWWQTIAVA